MKIESKNLKRVTRRRRIKGAVQDMSALYRDVQFTPAMPLRKLEQLIADFICEYNSQRPITHTTDRPNAPSQIDVRNGRRGLFVVDKNGARFKRPRVELYLDSIGRCPLGAFPVPSRRRSRRITSAQESNGK